MGTRRHCKKRVRECCLLAWVFYIKCYMIIAGSLYMIYVLDIYTYIYLCFTHVLEYRYLPFAFAFVAPRML